MSDDPFMRKHRGGQGNVWLVIGVGDDGEENYAIFSSIEKARAYAEAIEDICVHVPYVVDEPGLADVFAFVASDRRVVLYAKVESTPKTVSIIPEQFTNEASELSRKAAFMA